MPDVDELAPSMVAALLLDEKIEAVEVPEPVLSADAIDTIVTTLPSPPSVYTDAEIDARVLALPH